MPTSLSGRNFLKLLDFTPDEIRYLIKLSKEFKNLKLTGTPHRYLEGKNIVLLFEKTSTRTRCAFEVAGMDLGMGVTFLDPGSSQMGKKESIEDTAKVLGRMYDGIEYRGFDQELVEQLSRDSGVPVWNGLTDAFHPTQMLADMLTVEENFGNCKGLKFVFMGDARNNVANSLMVVCAKLGVNFAACAPVEFFPSEELQDIAQEIAAESGATLEFWTEPEMALKDADAVYTDIWVSMGEPDEVWEKRIHDLLPYQVNAKAFSYAKDSAIFMHCLPAFHDLNTGIGRQIHEKFGLSEMEVTDEVFEGPRSVVFDEAENRMHSIKAVVLATLR